MLTIDAYTRYRALLAEARPGVVVAVGPAGTGKTHAACEIAAAKLLRREVARIVLTRPAVVPEGETHGFLPGGLDSKMRPYLRPMLDAFGRHGLDAARLERLTREGRVEVCPIAFMRGRTFADAFVIADEAQNATPDQMRLLLTRAGERCKIVVAGDPSQCDLPAGAQPDGLTDLLQRLERRFEESDETVVDVVRFGDGDVRRSALARKMVGLYSA